MIRLEFANGTAVTMRRYNADDIDFMLDRIGEFLNHDRFMGFENHFKGVEFNRDKMKAKLIANVDNPKFFANLIFNDDGVLVAGLCGEICEYIFSSDILAVDYLFYFAPEFTNLQTLFAIIRAYVDWAEAHKVREVQLSSSTWFKQGKFEKLMRYIHFKPFMAGYSRRFR